MGQPKDGIMFCLETDGDGHWYVIPADKQKAWAAWEMSSDAADGITPDWAVEVGGAPSLVTFPSFKVR